MTCQEAGVRLARMSVEVDATLGGRWVSLRGRTGREWLCHREVAGRDAVRPSDPFVDAGGLEECLPTVAGEPDHGDVWSRPWTPEGAALRVRTPRYVLTRQVDVDDVGVTARYRLEGEPGERFVWAAHTLLDLSPGARLLVPRGRGMWVNGDGTSEGRWPDAGGRRLDVLGPDDGSALMVILPELRTIGVQDGDDVLTMSVWVEDQPSGVAVWRNLGGWPQPAPYRSVAVEPMLGYSPTLALAGPGEAAVVPPSGRVEWTLGIDG